jgi:GT2 family glycosyltransferase
MSSHSSRSECSVSLVVPSLGDAGRLGASLPAAIAAVSARGRSTDEVLVVDDSGAEAAAGAVPEILGALEGDARKASVRVVSTDGNQGFGRAVLRGAEEASGDLVFFVQDDVVVDAEVLGPLVDAITRADDVFAVAPRVRAVRADGTEAPTFESSVSVALVDDRIVVRERTAAELEEEDARSDGEPRAVDFVPSSAFLVRRDEFVEMGGFDPLFAPFDWEDVDLSLCARRRGRRLLEVPAATAAHRRMLGGLDDSTDADLARAVRERNRLLLRWKHLSTRSDASEHLVSLWRTILEAGLTGDRRTLEDVLLAFGRLNAVAESRARVSGGAVLVLDA